MKMALGYSRAPFYLSRDELDRYTENNISPIKDILQVDDSPIGERTTAIFKVYENAEGRRSFRPVDVLDDRIYRPVNWLDRTMRRALLIGRGALQNRPVGSTSW